MGWRTGGGFLFGSGAQGGGGGGGGAGGKLVQELSAAQHDVVACTTFSTGGGDGLPNNSNGTEVVTLAITPTSTDNKLIIEFSGFGGNPGQSGPVAVALFRDNITNGLAATSNLCHTTLRPSLLHLRHVMQVPSTDPMTFKIRVGMSSGTFYVNSEGADSERAWGGVDATWLTIREVAP